MGEVVAISHYTDPVVSATIFRNKGVIDKRAISTMGVCSKETDTPIGFFGTGLKYAIACLLRTGHSVIIYAGEEQLCFSARREDIRKGQFDIVYMNEERLGFTTELGKNWEMWQVLRELYSNCLDENGSMSQEQGVAIQHSYQPDETTIVVVGDDFYDIAKNLGEVFIQTAPDLVLPKLEIHPGGRCNKLFYRGIRVGEYDKPYMNKYNITDFISLTEDRTVKYQWWVDSIIRESIVTSHDRDFIHLTLTARKDVREGNINFTEVDSSTVPSAEFMEVVAELKFSKAEFNESAVTYYNSKLATRELVTTYFPDTIERQDFDDIIKQLEYIGIGFVEEFNFVHYLPGGAVVMCEGDDVFLSKMWFKKDIQSQKKILIQQYAEQYYSNATDALLDLILQLESMLLEQSLEAAPVKQWILNGTWSGYSSSQTKIVHTAIISAEQYEKAKHLHTIMYADGTSLSLEFSEYNPNYPVHEKLSYKSLIDEAIKLGKSTVSVTELP